MDITYALLTFVKLRSYANYDSYNTLLLSEPVCGICVLNEGNRNEFQRALLN